jgi:AraC-like DNA-binding protein
LRSMMQVTDALWMGDTAIRPGIGVFRGLAGDNRMHRHWAHQMTIGLERPVNIVSASGVIRAHVLFVLAGVAHQLMPGEVLSLYIDPATDEARAMLPMLGKTKDIIEPPSFLVSIVQQSFAGGALSDQSFECFRARLRLGALPLRDDRLEMVLRTLQASLEQEEVLSRRALATVADLSESRFSHWFREHTGMPVRSYRKWLRLVRGIEQVLAGGRLTDAAHGAGFADQAHFTRTFVETFGISPSNALAHLGHKPSGQ